MLKVGDHPELQAAVLALRSMDRDLRNDINRSTKATLDPVWKGLVQVHATSKMDSLVIAKGARIKAGNPPVATAATSTRKMKGGLVPALTWSPFEFGGLYNKVTTYERVSPKGNRHKVTRHTARQLPARTKSGRVAYPAMAEAGPRMASLWVQMIVAKVYEAFGMGR